MLDALRPVRTVLYTPEEPAVCGRNCSQPSRGPLEWRGQNATVRHSRSLNSAAHLGKGETALQCRLRTFGASAYYGAWSKAHAAYQLVREHEENVPPPPPVPSPALVLPAANGSHESAAPQDEVAKAASGGPKEFPVPTISAAVRRPNGWRRGRRRRAIQSSSSTSPNLKPRAVPAASRAAAGTRAAASGGIGGRALAESREPFRYDFIVYLQLRPLVCAAAARDRRFSREQVSVPF